MLKSAGIISMGGYLPAKEVPKKKRKQLVEYLRKETLLYPEYIDGIKSKGCLPGRVVTNYDEWESKPWFEVWVQNLPPKKRENPFQGTNERRYVPLDPVSLRNSLNPHPMLSSDAETLAGALALFNGGIAKEEIDLVLCSSFVPDLTLPQNASLIQHKLGLGYIGAYNIDTCCSSFLAMLEIAMTYVRCGLKKKILIASSAVHSAIIDPSYHVGVIFGDGAVAAVVGEVEEGYDYISSFSTSHGNRHNAATVKRRKPGMHISTTHGPESEQDFITDLDPKVLREIAYNAQEDMAEVVNKCLEKSGHTVADIDFLCLHQPVHWAADVWREYLGIPKNKSKETFQKYGNMANATVVTNLLEAVEEGLVKAGDKVLLASSGVGENHVAIFHRISPELIKNNRL